MTISKLKSDLRLKMRDLRKKIDLAYRKQSEYNLLEQIRSLLQVSSNIAIYHAAGSEISLKNIIDYCLSQNEIKLYQPIAYFSSKNMRFEEVDSYNPPKSLFYQEDYQLLNETKCYNLDLILVPLLAVDQAGHRLGQGGGYYDTTFADPCFRPVLCGIGFDEQLIDSVPYDAWDLELDYFVSEKRLVKFK